MFAWSRTFYAMKNGVYYNFEAKKDRDTAVNSHGYIKVSAAEAYKHYPQKRVYYSKHHPIDWSEE